MTDIKSISKKVVPIAQKYGADRVALFGNIKINMTDTPDKFYPMAEEIVQTLAEILRSVNQLEAEIYARKEEMRKKLPGGRYSPVEHPDMQMLWQEYRERYHAIFDSHCTKKFLNKRIDCCQSIGSSSNFSSLDTLDSEVAFSMKSKNKAVIIVYRDKSACMQMDYRFTMRLEDAWKVEEAAYQYADDKKWHTDRYM